MNGRPPPPSPDAIAALLSRWLPQGSEVSIAEIAPVFGGNARRAIGFEARWRTGGREASVPCVMLSALPGRHVESDPGVEFAVLRALEGQGVRAPRALAVDPRGEVLGAPTIVLERLPGVTSVVPILKAAALEVSRSVAAEFVDVAAELHAVDPALLAAGERLEPKAAVVRQIEHWRGVFETHRLEPCPALDSVFGWLEDHLPTPTRPCIVHGDLRLGNVLHDGGRITGLLDWEMAHLGDPLEDIAWIYRPMWSIDAFLPLADFVARYESRTGTSISPSSLRFWRVFSEVKFACISLSAAFLFATGRTANLRLADRAAMVPACLLRCLEWMADERRA